MKLKVGVVGATGYTGEEIVKLLSKHSDVEITSLTAIIDEPTPFSELVPSLKGTVDLVCKQPNVKEIASLTDLIFLALPHKVSMQYVPRFLCMSKKVIDLSADYRLDADVYSEWYEAEHKDRGNLANAVYGLPELYREEIISASLIANPGCYPTATILAAAPAVRGSITVGPILADAKSGVTGAGRKPSIALSFGEVDGNLKAYKINEHQHMPEMIRILSEVAKKDIKVMFVPHLIPMRRGILSTVYIPLQKELPEEDILELYRAFYKDELFVRVYNNGKLPEVKDVVGSNYCDIGLKVTGKLLVVISCIDNLLKGAAGQAVQNMNIMSGFKERKGLV